MNRQDLIENVFVSYALAKINNEVLKAIWSDRGKINDNDLIDLIRKTKPVLSKYVIEIEKDLDKDIRFTPRAKAELEEEFMILLEGFYEKLKKRR